MISLKQCSSSLILIAGNEVSDYWHMTSTYEIYAEWMNELTACVETSMEMEKGSSEKNVGRDQKAWCTRGSGDLVPSDTKMKM